MPFRQPHASFVSAIEFPFSRKLQERDEQFLEKKEKKKPVHNEINALQRRKTK